MEYLSLLLADRMIKCQVIEEDDKKYYAYSIQLLLEKITGILLISGFALVFKSLVEVLIFLITFSLIQIHSDGIHCKTSIGCFISSVIVSLSTIPVSSVLMKSPVICQGGGDIINDFYVLHWYDQKPQFRSFGAGAQSP